MGNYDHIELTAAEISTLWTQYQSKSLAICVLKHSINHVDDNDIKLILEDTLTVMNTHMKKVTELFNKENYPIPHGFTDEDVDVHKPRLFSDKLYLLYLLNASYISLDLYSKALTAAAREDIIDYYSESLSVLMEHHKRIKETAKEKGIFIRAPHLPRPDKIDFVKKQNFLTGWFGNRRPLNAMEITNIDTSARRNALGQALITGFQQVATSKEIKGYFKRGREISGKHLEVFSSILQEDDLPIGAMSLISEVTDTTESPFSERLMMHLVASLNAAGISQYGFSLAESPRHDLGAHYTRLTAELANFINDGANILIDQGWMEQPPMAPDRKDLVK
ncbi:DUF3231 family protein [Oceanobacillus halophilus]|uniref:DUF3231 family protein n=1 Tax=Oceanobacillus halophilus TaxID=930130 RepID=UPI001313FDDF|nr:DUF3231 family protein [Oceanobacillus halophilus]